MITEDYVSFEIAKLLKEKGFSGNTICKYADVGGITEKYYDDYRERVLRFDWKEGYLIEPLMEPKDQYEIIGNTILAPTLQMAIKWLREARNIDIEVHTDVGMLGVKVYTPFISRYKSSTEHPSKLRQYKKGLYFEDDRGVIPAIKHFETYEEAIEVALKYALEKLI